MRLGVVTGILYCVQFSRELGDDEVGRIAGMVLERPLYDLTAEEQYTAVEAALAEDVWDQDLSWQPHGEPAVRDFLRRLLARLDTARPWREPPLRALGFDRWEEYRHGTLLARVRLHAPSQDRLHARLRTVPGDPDGLRGVVLRLRSGDEVALIAPPLPDGYEAHLRALPPHRPAAELLEAFLTHTECEPERVTPARSARG
ncbi:hypothetical protein [Streptomyces sp. Amel2xC10]|uniref:hypothetical protein n=1 Tax=Streptomyces sp. Amel2xC10 TaxID=1305826 RepID=UPI000A08A76A|nr:hypothetical protein [Streptomyces sp. Amel2xC10]SMF74538.1 hypothetical protein SAMN02745830_05756 [Streptomyces sp. Amel2xC10]